MNMQVARITDKAMQDITLAGGKGASLSKLVDIDGINVPDGFIVTTQVYCDVIEPAIQHLIEEISKTYTGTVSVSAKIKEAVNRLTFPPHFEDALKKALDESGRDAEYAVRSSATAEDLPDASFAGQQDSFLNVRGYDNIKASILSCFASLYNERAIAYRIKNGFADKDVSMAVVVQKMVPSKVSGVMFTADPITSDRYTVVVEAVEGLGEELVSGRKTPVTWHVKNDEVRLKNKAHPILSDSQVKALCEVGKKIEADYGQPQDIEWCFADGKFFIVQSRAITTLYPLPPSPDGFKRCFLSFAHMQMMTDVMLPLGVSMSKMMSENSLHEIGGRLYIDVTHDLSNAYGRKLLFQKASNLDPLMNSALIGVAARKAYIKNIPKGKNSFQTASFLMPTLLCAFRMINRGSALDIDKYLEKHRLSLNTIRKKFETLSGNEAMEAIEDDTEYLRTEVVFDPVGFGMVLAAQFVQSAINKAGEELLGDKNIVNGLSLSVEHNVTSEMGLALSEIAGMIRRNPKAAALFEEIQSIDCLRDIESGKQIIDAWDSFIHKYGMRCPGEIDITKRRFWEEPAQLLPSLANNIKYLEDNHTKELFEQGRHQSQALADKLVQAMHEKHGAAKARKLRRKIEVFRTFAGVREYPKYFWICRYDVYKRAILCEAERLVLAGTLKEPDDVFYLYYDELREAVHSGHIDNHLIDSRKKKYAAYKTLTPPRVIFSDGEVPEGKYSEIIPEGALAGLGVSSGVIEGRARVAESLEDAHIEKGDILVTKFTDPSWTPAFVSISGLVTEVGGMMTHGAVITREYGLPAVVGVVGATRLIQNGDRIRINGNVGYVEVLS